MAVSSIAQAYKRTARLAASAIVTEPEATVVRPEILKARQDFRSFFKLVFGKDMPRHMKTWQERIMTGQANERLLEVAGPATALLAPRGGAKSTYLGLLIAWLIGKHVEAGRLLRILYISYNIDVSRGKSQSIKNILRDKTYQAVFPMVRLNKKKQSDELWAIDFDYAGISVTGEDAFTLACAGLRGTIASKRSDLVVLDDLIKSPNDIKNPEVRREMEKNWTAVIRPTMFPGARAIALGTRFHWDDVFATTFCEKKGWHVIAQPALEYDAEGEVKSYWPEEYSLKDLLARKADDPVEFAYQYLNRPVRRTELGVEASLFIKGEVPMEYDTVGVGIDLSAGMGERNDYTVMTLAGRLDDKCYIIDYRRIRAMGNLEKMEALAELLAEWNLVTVNSEGQFFPTNSEVWIWPETVAYQKSFEGDAKRILYNDWQLHNLRISPVKGVKGGDKLARFRGIMGLFETKKVIFNKYRNFDTMIEEITNLGNAPHDDCADSVQMVLSGLMKRGKVEVEYA